MTSLCLYDAFECLKCVEGAEDAKADRAAQIITASIKTAAAAADIFLFIFLLRFNYPMLTAVQKANAVSASPCPLLISVG